MAYVILLAFAVKVSAKTYEVSNPRKNSVRVRSSDLKVSCFIMGLKCKIKYN